MTTQSLPVVVAGAGIIGASIAYHLARQGRSVIVVEKGEPAQGATADSFAWINASRGKTPNHYYELNRAGIDAWRALDGELGGALNVIWGGSVEWGADSAETETILTKTEKHRATGYPLEAINAHDLAELEPNIDAGSAEVAVYTPIEGHVDPVAATHTLLQYAQQLGAVLRTDCAIVGLIRPNNQLQAVETTQGTIETEQLVIACGNGSPQIAAYAGIDVPMQESPGVLAHSAPSPALINRVVLSPHGHMKQKPDGRILIGSSFSGTEGTDDSIDTGRRQFDHAAQSLPQLGEVTVEKMTLGWRVLPADDLPIVGHIGGTTDLYLAVMHSGITLGPLIGRLAAQEIMTGDAAERLAPYRLARFSEMGD